MDWIKTIGKNSEMKSFTLMDRPSDLHGTLAITAATSHTPQFHTMSIAKVLTKERKHQSLTVTVDNE